MIIMGKPHWQGSAKQAIVYAIKTGEYLLKAKEKVPHGEWENWVKSCVGSTISSTSQASRYMRLAKNKELAHIVNDTNSIWELYVYRFTILLNCKNCKLQVDNYV